MKSSPIKVNYVQHCGNDLTVVNAARVSFDKESAGDTEDQRQRDAKLISYLANHGHKSPFNHCFLTFRVKAPIFVARQLVKHKFMPWNEVSRRYVDTDPEFYFPEHWRARAENVKQGSSEDAIDLAPLLHMETENGCVSTPEEMAQASLTTYDALLQLGVCPEQARMVLPQNIMTEWYWSGTLGAFADMCNLRLDPHTQQETREVAQFINDIILQLFPLSWKALTK